MVVDCINRVKRLVSLKKGNRAICVEFDYATSRLFIGNADETISIYDLGLLINIFIYRYYYCYSGLFSNFLKELTLC